MSRRQMNLLQGTLDVLVLKALAHDPRHGYGVAEWVRNTTDGTLHIEDGALYTSLHRMEKRGWIAAEWGISENNRRAKYYRVTKAGMRRLAKEAKAWRRYAAAVFEILEPADIPKSGGKA